MYAVIVCMASSGFKVNAGFPPAAKLTIIVSPIALEIDNIKDLDSEDKKSIDKKNFFLTRKLQKKLKKIEKK